MLAQQRRARIVEMVSEAGGLSVTDLASRLGVSASTIRRDLNTLDRRGVLQRVRGGGACEVDDQPFQHVAARSSQEKERIGQVAADLVSDRDVVVLDIGTTCAAVARHLRGRQVTVVTASLAVVDELREDRGVEVIVLGGLLRPSYLSLVGSLTENALRELSADIAFIGTSGVRGDGVVMDSTGTEVPIKHAIRSAADRCCLLATSDKFPGSGLLPVCRLDELETVVTTVEPTHAPLADLEGSDTEVLFV
nr:DeoR/GlpR family DNA-binding transcription regulator [Actinomyces sp.]